MIALRPSFSPRTSPTTVPSARLAKALRTVRAADGDPQALRRAHAADAHERIAAADEVGAAREHRDRDRPGGGARRRGGGQEEEGEGKAAPVTIAAQRVVRTSDFML